jgi:multiple sugar transport system permease protein
VTVALFQFVASWNDFFAPLIYLSNSSMYTLPVAVRFFQGLYTADLGPLMAIACVTVLSIIIIFLFAQRVFVQGIATTGIKGG